MLTNVEIELIAHAVSEKILKRMASPKYISQSEAVRMYGSRREIERLKGIKIHYKITGNKHLLFAEDLEREFGTKKRMK